MTPNTKYKTIPYDTLFTSDKQTKLSERCELITFCLGSGTKDILLGLFTKTNWLGLAKKQTNKLIPIPK